VTPRERLEARLDALAEAERELSESAAFTPAADGREAHGTEEK